MADTMDIIKGISQVMANTYDGAKDKDGNVLHKTIKFDAGKGVETYEMRDMIKGFRARISGNKLIVSFQTELTSKEAHDPKLESNIESDIADSIKYLKKEFKKVTGKELSLKQSGEMKMRVESTSRMRTFATATCTYDIGGVKEEKSENKVANAIKSWLKLGKNKGPKGVGDKLPSDLNAADGE